MAHLTAPSAAGANKAEPRRCGPWRRPPLLVPLLVLAGACIAGAATAAPHPARAAAVARPRLGDLVTFGYGNARSGWDRVDPHIGGLSASPAWDDRGLGAVYGQPLVYDGRVYVATETDMLEAIAARTGRVLWSVRLGTPVSLSVVDSTPTLGAGCGNIDPLGVTGTPVIDPAADELFAVEETETDGADDWQHVRHELLAVSLATHRVKWRRDVDPPGGNTASGYYIPAEQQRPALTLSGGRLYAAFGGLYGDCGQYHGFVVEVLESGGGPERTYEVPSAREAAVWETDGALVSSGGDLYVATGNGASTSLADFDEGNAVIELSPTLRRLGVWAPSNWAQLSAADWDLGSSGPVAVPGSSLLFVAGKPTSTGSVGYLMAEGHLGGVGNGASSAPVCTSGGAFGADAAGLIGTGTTARTMVFVPCGGGTVGLSVDAGAARFSRLWVASSGSPDGSPVLAGGVLWVLEWPHGGLEGIDPSSGQVILERSTDNLAHFAAPGIGDGMLVVPTTGGVEAFTTSA